MGLNSLRHGKQMFIVDDSSNSKRAEALNSLEQKALVKAYILEAGVAVHGVIMGFGMGALNNSGKTAELEILLVVYVCHQVYFIYIATQTWNSD